MKRIAILSDLHSNLEALQAVAKNLEVDDVIALGDSVGYGANPNEVLDWIKDRNCMVIRGNHEEATITGNTGWFNPMAARSILWTRQMLTSANLDFLSSLEEKKLIELDGIRIRLVHGSPNDPLFEYVYEETHRHLFEYYLQKEEADIIALGHTHVPFLWRSTKGIILNPGSVGQPRDGDKRASFAILRVEDGVPTVEHHRVGYSIDVAANKIRSAGLPEMLAERLYYGR